MEWIKVSDRLPEKFKRVLIITEMGIVIGELYKNSRWFSEESNFAHEVTHWMPLPDPPK